MIINKELRYIVEILNENAIIKNSINKLYFIGKGKNNEILNDIDFVAFIDDNMPRYEFIKIFTEIIQDYIVANKILISCFPIHSKYMTYGYSMFVNNVLNYGKEIIK